MVIALLVAVILIFFQLFMPSGLVNTFLRSIEVLNPPGWLGSSAWVKPAIMLMMIKKTAGYQMTLFLAGLQGISPTLSKR